MTMFAACANEHAQSRLRFTGKERDAESGNDYFDARYYSSAMGRFLSPDWSAKEDPVPYANLENPQTLNLYSYVQNNPLLKPDLDGHGCPPDCGELMQDVKAVVNNPYVQGGAQIAIGVGLVATAAVGDAPGGVVGALMITNAVLGGTATAVNGTVQIAGAATNTDTTEAREALSSTSTLPGLATAAATGGNLKAANAVSTVTNAATLASDPKGAVKNAATGADAVHTVKDTTSLASQAVSAVKSAVSGALAPTPAPPPTPAAPKPPACGSTPGAC